jgi:hypothetical protein
VAPEAGERVIDFGCGGGEGGKALKELYGLEPTFFDLRNYADLSPFIQGSLWHRIPRRNPTWDYGYCCDVMEHLPKQFTMLAVSNMLHACTKGVFFTISFLPDNFGKVIGEPLHLTVEIFQWWRDNLRELGEVIEARDIIGEGVFYVTKDHANVRSRR